MSGQFKKSLIKLKRWEFWPTWIVYLPVLLIYPIWAMRAGSIFFFALVNPKISMGGLYGASKSELLGYINDADKPKTLLFQKELKIDVVITVLNKNGLLFPVIIKPDYGERGKGIEYVNDTEHLARAIRAQTSDFIIQEYIDWEFEAGVFLIRMPNESKGNVTSIVSKGFLYITGDGHSTVEELLLRDDRGVLVWEKLKKSVDSRHILPENEKLLLEPIGNHSRGTAFLNGNHLKTDELENWANQIADRIPEFFYGRFDIRSPSELDFCAGRNIKILEVNGANAEPAHIYEPGAKLMQAWSTLIEYWSIVFKISVQNHNRYAYPQFKEALHAYRNWQSINTKKEKS